jgi:hypothetical protein
VLWIDRYPSGYAKVLESDATDFGTIVILQEALLVATGLPVVSLFYPFKGPRLAAGFLHQPDVGNGHGAVR